MMILNCNYYGDDNSNFQALSCGRRLTAQVVRRHTRRGSSVLKICRVFGQCSVVGLLIVLALPLLCSAPTELYLAFILVGK